MRSTERLTLAVKAPDGTTLDCETAPRNRSAIVTTVVDGLVVSASANSFNLDACPPNADCKGTTYTFTVDAPGLTIGLKPGTKVRTRHRIGAVWACTVDLVVTSLPGWGAVASPVEGALLLAANDGGEPVADAPFLAEHDQLGCHPAPTCNGIKTGADEYQFRFRARNVSADQVVVPMGETRDLVVDEASRALPLRVRNLRSFQTERCDDYWNWAYWIAPRE